MVERRQMREVSFIHQIFIESTYYSTKEKEMATHSSVLA